MKSQYKRSSANTSSRAARNPEPRYTRPETYSKDLPAFIARTLDNMEGVDPSAHPAFYLGTGRQRIIRDDGRKSIGATLRTIIANADVLTATTTISCTSMARQAGLMTTSQAGKNAITRFTRALKKLVQAGAVQASIERDPESGQFLSAVVTITALGWSIAGTSASAWKAAARMRANLQGRPLATGDAEDIDLKQRSAERMAAWRETQRQRRREKAIHKRERTLARRAAVRSDGKQLHALVNAMIKVLSVAELAKLGAEGLKKRALRLLASATQDAAPPPK